MQHCYGGCSLLFLVSNTLTLNITSLPSLCTLNKYSYKPSSSSSQTLTLSKTLLLLYHHHPLKPFVYLILFSSSLHNTTKTQSHQTLFFTVGVFSSLFPQCESKIRKTVFFFFPFTYFTLYPILPPLSHPSIKSPIASAV